MNMSTNSQPNEESSSKNKIERTDFQDKEKYLSHKSQNIIERRHIPKPAEMERRNTIMKWVKWGLPITALVLLSSIAVWPEIDRALHTNKEVMKQLSRIKIESGTMIDATFHGLDTHNRPYTITSEKVVQKSNNSNLIHLGNPKADILLQDNVWMMVTADKGNYTQHEQDLGLTKHVVLYRNDGVFMYSDMADVALKSSVVTGNNWIHAEGPFGILDAQTYFLDLHAGIAQFKGPGRLVLNDDKKNNSSNPTQAKSSE